MKVQEVILRAMAKKITWWQAAEIIGHERPDRCADGGSGMKSEATTGWWTGGAGRPSQKRVARWSRPEQVLGLYREKYFDLNVRHFHEKLREEHEIQLSYTWVKAALQGAGLVAGRANAACTAEAAAAAGAGDAAAHRRQPASVVSG